MISLTQILFIILGLLVAVLSSVATVKNLGYIMFGCGLLALLLNSNEITKIFSR